MDQTQITIDFLSMPIEYARKLGIALRSLGFKAVLHSDPRELLESYDPNQFGTVLLYDWSDGQDSLELIRELKKQCVPARIVLLVTSINLSIVARAARFGADDVLLTSEPEQKIIDSVRQAVRLDRVQRPKDLTQLSQLDCFKSLTPPERSVLQLILAGESNKVIAKRLEVSQRTIESRRQKVFKKTKTQSVAELSRMATRLEKHVKFLRIDGVEQLAGPKGFDDSQPSAS